MSLSVPLPIPIVINASGLLPLLAIILVPAGAVILAVLRLNRADSRCAERARAEAAKVAARAIAASGREAPSRRQRLMQALARIADHLPLFDGKQRGKFSQQLQSAGIHHPLALQIFITVKLAAGTAGGLLTGFVSRLIPGLDSGMMPAICVLGGLVAGLIIPELLLDMAIRRRRRAIHQALPDALDLMVICTNAGFSLGATLRRISMEMADITPELASEMGVTADDIALQSDPMAGLRNLSERTGVPSLNAVVTTLIQSQRYGTPITQSLRTLARVERRTRMLVMEEKGAKLSTKITIPMMVLILPAVLMLAGGPAFLRIMEVFGK